jgi:excisionase family DNA binding protein
MMNDSIQELQREGLSVFEACTVAGIGRTRLYYAIATGELVARKFGKRRIILRDDLRNFLSKLPIDARPVVRSQENGRG